MTEMICVSPDGRISPGCGGLWTDEQRDGWARVVDFVHAEHRREIGCQLGHSGAQGLDQADVGGHRRAAARGNWAVVAASAGALLTGVNQTPRELTGPAWTRSATSSWPSARRAAEAGLRPARAALRARLPALRLPLAGDQPAHRRVRRRHRRPAPLPARGVARDARGVAGRPADDRADLGHRLGRRRPDARRRARGRRGVRGGRRGRHRRVDRPGDQGASGRRSAAATRRRTPTRSATGSASRRSRSASSRRTTT